MSERSELKVTYFILLFNDDTKNITKSHITLREDRRFYRRDPIRARRD